MHTSIPCALADSLTLLEPSARNKALRPPMTIGELPLSGSVRFHYPDRSVGLEVVVLERGFILETIRAAVPHNVFAILAPDGM
jgi:hypothetical protein